MTELVKIVDEFKTIKSNSNRLDNQNSFELEDKKNTNSDQNRGSNMDTDKHSPISNDTAKIIPTNAFLQAKESHMATAKMQGQNDIDDIFADLDMMMYKNVNSLFNITPNKSDQSKVQTTYTFSDQNDLNLLEGLSLAPLSTSTSKPNPSKAPADSKQQTASVGQGTRKTEGASKTTLVNGKQVKAGDEQLNQTQPGLQSNFTVEVVKQHQSNLSIYQESKNIFSSYRVFTLKTNPGNFTVKRTRIDFKWLCDKLKEEYPSVSIPPLDKVDLSKKVIEDFFATLKSNSVQQSRHVMYFLQANDKMFEERKNNESSLMSMVMNKLRKSSCSLESLKIESNERTKVQSFIYIRK